jgi:hypothetical protein
MRYLFSILILVALFGPVLADAGIEPFGPVVADPSPPAPLPDAAPPPDVLDDPSGFAGELLSAVRDRRWLALAGLVLLALVTVTRRFVLGKVAWAQTRVGAIALAVGVSLAATFGLALASSAPVTGALLLEAITLALTAGGLYSWIHEKLPWLGAKPTA